jgi:membrane protease subunit HflC
MYKLLLLLIIVLVLIVFRLSFFTVDATEFVYLTQFGKPVAVYDGNVDSEAGFHWCWPWPVQSVLRLDRRLQFFDLPSRELVTTDAKTKNNQDMLIVEGYACWRIDSNDVELFVRRLGTPQRAEDILGKRISSQLGDVIQQMSTNDLVNTDATVVEATMKRLWQRVTVELQHEVSKKYGVELVDVQLRRFSYSPQVRGAIFDRIRSERNKKAEEFTSLGKKKADDIRTDGDEQKRTILAEARKKEKQLKGEAEYKAALTLYQAYSKDPEFYMFRKKLESLESILGNGKTMLLLSSHRDIFKMLFEGPQGPMLNGRPPGVAAAPPKGNGSHPTNEQKGQ